MRNHRQNGNSKLLVPICLVLGTVLFVTLKLGFVFLLIALMPAIVSYYVDNTPSKYMFRTVIACNLATALHPLVDLLKYGLHVGQQRFYSAIADPQMWLFIYMGAAAGWGLIYMLRFVANFGVSAYHDYQLYVLQREQRSLFEEWGKDVVGENEPPIGKR